MFTLSSILIIIGSIVMILIVLAQNSKGGGLASSFGGANQVAGVQQTNKFLDKLTWSVAIGLLVLSIVASLSLPRTTRNQESVTATQLEAQPVPTNQNTPIIKPEDVKETNKDKQTK